MHTNAAPVKLTEAEPLRREELALKRKPGEDQTNTPAEKKTRTALIARVEVSA